MEDDILEWYDQQKEEDDILKWYDQQKATPAAEIQKAVQKEKTEVPQTTKNLKPSFFDHLSAGVQEQIVGLKEQALGLDQYFTGIVGEGAAAQWRKEFEDERQKIRGETPYEPGDYFSPAWWAREAIPVVGTGLAVAAPATVAGGLAGGAATAALSSRALAATSPFLKRIGQATAGAKASGALAGAVGAQSGVAGLQSLGQEYERSRQEGRNHQQAAENATRAGIVSAGVNGLGGYYSSRLLGPDKFADIVGNIAGFIAKNPNAAISPAILSLAKAGAAGTLVGSATSGLDIAGQNVATGREVGAGLLDALVLGAVGGIADPIMTSGAAYLGARDILKKPGPSDLIPPKDDFDQATGGKDFIEEKSAEIASNQMVETLGPSRQALYALDDLAGRDPLEVGAHEGVRKVEETISEIDEAVARQETDEVISVEEPKKVEDVAMEDPVILRNRHAATGGLDTGTKLAPTNIFTSREAIYGETPTTLEGIGQVRSLEDILADEINQIDTSLIKKGTSLDQGKPVKGYFYPANKAIRVLRGGPSTEWHEYGHALDIASDNALTVVFKTLDGMAGGKLPAVLLGNQAVEAYAPQLEMDPDIYYREMAAEFLREVIKNPTEQERPDRPPFPIDLIKKALGKTQGGQTVLDSIARIQQEATKPGGPMSSPQMSSISRTVSAFDPPKLTLADRWESLKEWFNRAVNDYTAPAKGMAKKVADIKLSKEDIPAFETSMEDAFGRVQNMPTIVSDVLVNGWSSPEVSMSGMLGKIADKVRKILPNASQEEYQGGINSMIKWFSSWMRERYRLTGLHERQVRRALRKTLPDIFTAWRREYPDDLQVNENWSKKEKSGFRNAEKVFKSWVLGAGTKEYTGPALKGDPFPNGLKAISSALEKVHTNFDALLGAIPEKIKKNPNFIKFLRRMVDEARKAVKNSSPESVEYANLDAYSDTFGKEVLTGSAPFMEQKKRDDTREIADSEEILKSLDQSGPDELAMARAARNVPPEIQNLFESLASTHRQIYDEGITMLERSGSISSKKADALRSNSKYVSFMRDSPLHDPLTPIWGAADRGPAMAALLGQAVQEYETRAATSTGGQLIQGAGTPVKQAVTGSYRPLLDVFQPLAMFIYETTKEVESNNLKKLFYTLADPRTPNLGTLKDEGTDAFVAEVDRPPREGEPTITLKIGGKPRYLQFRDRAVFEGIVTAMKVYEPFFSEPALDRLAAKISQFVRSTIVLPPAFIYRELIRNPISLLVENPSYAGGKKDFADAYLSGAETWKELLSIWGETMRRMADAGKSFKAILSAKTEEEAATAYQSAFEKEKALESKLSKAGVPTNSFYANLGREDLIDTYKSAIARTAQRTLMTKPEMLMGVWERLAKESQLVLQKRLYQKVLKETGNESLAAIQAREILNTRRVGSAVNKFGRLALFLPSIVRAVGITGNALKNHPKQSLGMALAILTPFFLAHKAAMMATGQDERWREAAGSAYDSSIAFPLPSALDQTGGESWLTVPLPPFAGLLWGALNRSIDTVAGKGAGAADYAQSVARALPTDLFGSMPAYRGGVITAANYDPFFARHVIPPQELHLDKEERPRAHEGSPIGDLASFLTLSTMDPRTADAYIGTFFGGVGQVATGITRDIERLNLAQAAVRAPLRVAGILKDTNILSARWVREVDSYVRRKSGAAGTSEAKEWNAVKRKLRTARGDEFERLRTELEALYNGGILEAIKRKVEGKNE